MSYKIEPYIVAYALLFLQTAFNITYIYWADRVSNRVRKLETRQASAWLQELLTRVEKLENKIR